MSRERTGDVLLKIAANAIDGCIDITNCFLKPYQTNKKGYQKFQKLTDLVSRKAADNATRRLKEKGCLEKISRGGKTCYRITEKGRNKIEKIIFDRETWDGKWRVVLFDIPETKKKLRDNLRTTLKAAGFKQLQKSVWVSPFDTLKDVEIMVDNYNLHENLWYFWAKSFKNDEGIIEMFLEK